MASGAIFVGLKSMSKLTKRQSEIRALIEAHLNTTGSPPTRAEIAKAMGFKSPNAAEDHLRALARKGVIELIPSTSRGIRLIQHAGIPLLSRVHIGHPILSEHNIKHSCKLDRHLFQPAIDFLIRANTSEFKPWGILEEDYLAIHQYNPSEPLQKGQWVVIREANELLLQHLNTEMDLINTHAIEGIVVGVIRPLLTPDLA